jgi:hypothetical protein
MAPAWDDARDRVQVGAFFGSLSGLIALGVVLIWAWATPASGGAACVGSILLLHLGYVLLYALAGALIGRHWPTRRSARGRWGLWFLATATGAVTVNSALEGPVWSWSLAEWGRWILMAVLFTPVFAWSPRRGGHHP